MSKRKPTKTEAEAARKRRSEAGKRAAATRAANREAEAKAKAAADDVDEVRNYGKHRAAAERTITRLAAGNADLADGIMAETIRGAADALDGENVKPGERSTLMNTIRRSLAHLEQSAPPKPPERSGLDKVISGEDDE